MGKTEAQLIAREARYTWGQLRAMLDAALAANPTGPSRVNPILPRQQALSILRAAREDAPADEIPGAWRRDHFRHRDLPSRDFTIVCNILREAGEFREQGA